jgi:hypothetical protein
MAAPLRLSVRCRAAYWGNVGAADLVLTRGRIRFDDIVQLADPGMVTLAAAEPRVNAWNLDISVMVGRNY